MPMPPDEPPPEGFEAEVEEIREIVPSRAVLTELARGFLLVHETNTTRAVQFALTFLREQTGRAATAKAGSVPTVTQAQRSLGRLPRGPVEPAGSDPGPWTDVE